MHTSSPNVSCFSNKSLMISKKSKLHCPHPGTAAEFAHLACASRAASGGLGHRMCQNTSRLCSLRIQRGAGPGDSLPQPAQEVVTHYYLPVPPTATSNPTCHINAFRSQP